MQSLPIIIGSQALHLVAPKVNPYPTGRTDVLLSENTNLYISLLSESFNTSIYHDNKLSEVLRRFCREVDFYGNKVLLPSVEALVILYRASATRAREYPFKQWSKNLKTLSQLFGKDGFDHDVSAETFGTDVCTDAFRSMPYDNYGVYENLYQAAVKYTARRWGDAPSMSSSPASRRFLKRKHEADKRIFSMIANNIIDLADFSDQTLHDEVYSCVSKMLRGDDAKDLFDEFRLDGKVELDTSKFNAKANQDPNFILQLVNEEIIILYITRYILVRKTIGNHDAYYEVRDTIEPIIAYFITNLCGNVKDGFLRRFLIHHYDELMKQYDETRMIMIAYMSKILSERIIMQLYSVEPKRIDYYPVAIKMPPHSYPNATLDAVRDPEFRAAMSVQFGSPVIKVPLAVEETPGADMVVLAITGAFFVITPEGEVRDRGSIRVIVDGELSVFEGTVERGGKNKAVAEMVYEACTINFQPHAGDIEAQLENCLMEYTTVSSTLLGRPNKAFRALSMYLFDNRRNCGEYKIRESPPRGSLVSRMSLPRPSLRISPHTTSFQYTGIIGLLKAALMHTADYCNIHNKRWDSVIEYFSKYEDDLKPEVTQDVIKDAAKIKIQYFVPPPRNPN